jgi:hypothetical protein
MQFQNQPGSFCDGLSRRSFLRVGALAGVGSGLNMGSLLQAKSATNTHKSVIVVYLSGGLSHQDTFDPKPNAPSEVRGEFKTMPTSVPGVHFTDMVPLLARNMDKMALVRSLVGYRDEHSSFHNLTGYPMDEAKRDGKPHIGAVTTRMLGPVDPVIPPFIDLFPTMQHRPYNSPGAGNLGRQAQGVRVDGQDIELMKLRGLTKLELGDRNSLRERLDLVSAGLDRVGVESQYRRAFDVLNTSALVEALDVEREPQGVRERYGRGSPKHLGDGAPLWNDQLLMARRLVEAGTRLVTVAYGFWDTHGNNFGHLKQHLPTLDQGISALVEDIHSRGMDKDCLVVVCGEFGRTPKINKDGGRDHWARVNFSLLSGGGLKKGVVLGATDSTAGEVRDNPIHHHDLLATIYHSLGIDPHDMVKDVSDRPIPILPSTAKTIEKLLV